jgi:pimeloyl-ACP methyl ester carboxylesterase
MLNLVLIHGAWHGAWCWDKLVPYLNNIDKINLIVPDYSHITRPTNGSFIDAYINYILSIVQEQKKSEQFVLVGHSLGGIIITKLWQQLRNIQQLIYIAGFIPNSGMSLSDCAKEDTAVDISLCFKFVKNCIAINTDNATEYFYNTCSKQDIEYALSKIIMQPIASFNEKIFYDVKLLRQQKLTYLACRHDRAVSFAYQKQMQKKVAAKMITLNSCHSPFLSMPQQLAKILVENIAIC